MSLQEIDPSTTRASSLSILQSDPKYLRRLAENIYGPLGENDDPLQIVANEAARVIHAEPETELEEAKIKLEKNLGLVAIIMGSPSASTEFPKLAMQALAEEGQSPAKTQ